MILVGEILRRSVISTSVVTSHICRGRFYPARQLGPPPRPKRPIQPSEECRRSARSRQNYCSRRTAVLQFNCSITAVDYRRFTLYVLGVVLGSTPSTTPCKYWVSPLYTQYCLLLRDVHFVARKMPRRGF